MFRWYQRAAVCYAYLFDVLNSSTAEQAKLDFYNSRWFTRGWTLQELLAPLRVTFFTRDWGYLGTKIDMTAVLADITGISELALSNSNMDGFSIAQRMSWASKRVTTRSEDIAYCLMGIFDVNMPLLYGEGGEKAFLRLQEELLRSSDDQSLFVWGNVSAPRDHVYQNWTEYIFTGGRELLCPTQGQHLFAKSPANFARYGNVIPFHRSPDTGSSSLTNKGVRLAGLFIPHSPNEHEDNRHGYTALLDVHFAGNLYGQIGIHLDQCTKSKDRYSRTLSDPMVIPLTALPHAVEEIIYVKGPELTRCITGQPVVPVEHEEGPLFVIPKYSKRGRWQLCEVCPPEQWQERDGLFRPKAKGFSPQYVLFSYTKYDPSHPKKDPFEAPLVILLKYVFAHFREFHPRGFTILGRVNSPLKFLSERTSVLPSTTFNKFDKYTTFEEAGVYTNVKLQVRESKMLGKVLHFLDVDIWTPIPLTLKKG
jgi:hypothetical protein